MRPLSILFIYLSQKRLLPYIHVIRRKLQYAIIVNLTRIIKSIMYSHQYPPVFKTFLMPKESIFLLSIYTPVWVVLLVQILLLNIDRLLVKWGILRIEEL